MMRWVALVAAALLALTSCTTGEDAVVRGSEFTFVSPGGKTTIHYKGADRQPLELAGSDLMHEGKTLSTADFENKVVVINIWGTWCGPCRTEAPELQRVYEKTKDEGVVVLGIDVRDYSRTVSQDFMRDRGLTYPSIFDPPGRSLLALKGYPRNIVPSTIVLDRQHRVATVFLKPLLAEDLLPVVRDLAREPAARQR